MTTPISHITIVGGGTAGWITAAYLNHRLQWGPTAQPGVSITVVEAPEIPTIGVGEATVPTLKGTLRMLDIDEAEFVKRTAATLKMGIVFEDWQHDERGRPYAFLHPFTGGTTIQGRAPGYSLLHHEDAAQQGGSAFVNLISMAGAAIAAGRGPRAIGSAAFDGPLRYAYHVDAGLLAAFFKEICLARGVCHVADRVSGWTHDDRGHLASLQLAERGNWPVELVIDCTGFRGLLINDAMGEPFESFAPYLLNDRAVPIQVARRDPDRMLPATTARAMRAGWGWRIPIQPRDGTGYVYSSSFISDDDAVREAEEALGDDERLTDARVIRMRVGRSRRAWVGNCVAIGSAGGFVEPLESSGILSIEQAARWLLHYFPSAAFEAPLRQQFNALTQGFYAEVRDFLTLHFCLGNRSDTPYWRAARHEARRSDAVIANLDLWRHALPSGDDLRRKDIFSHWSIQCLLFGKGFYRGATLRPSEVVPLDSWRRYRADWQARTRSTVAALPSHAALIAAIRAEAVDGNSASRVPRRYAATPADDLVIETSRVMGQASRAPRPVPATAAGA